jgi:CheY-like chemotaxis protein/anti-sigma regulatory factor (Ser/Thr protein kinase)
VRVSRILAIDDEPQVLSTVAKLLKAEGHEVDTAEDGATGIAQAAARHPDLILCDIIMPHPNGFEVLAALRRDPATAAIPVVFLTGVPDPTRLRAGKSLGAEDYLLKPFTREELVQAIEARLARVAFIRREADQRLQDLRTTLAGSLPRNLLMSLTSMLGLSAFLRDEGARLPPELVCELGQGVFEGSQRFQRAMEKIVFYADLERLAQATRTTPAFSDDRSARTGQPVTEAAQAAVEAAGRQADLTLSVEDVAVCIDLAHLRRLVLEIVDNAARYSPRGTPLAVECRRADTQARIAVSDRGPGLPPDLRAEMDAPAGGCRSVDDSGFGLAIVRRIVSLYRGEVALGARPDGGTTVTVALALAR